jgi:hypothetical protein
MKNEILHCPNNTISNNTKKEIIYTPNKHIADHTRSWLGTSTSIIGGGVK